MIILTVWISDYSTARPRSAGAPALVSAVHVGLHLHTPGPPEEAVAVVDGVLVLSHALPIEAHLSRRTKIVLKIKIFLTFVHPFFYASSLMP